jgi:hypothetical protein
LLVTDGVLATAELFEGELRVEEVDYARLALSWPIADAPAVIIDVVRSSAISRWVRDWMRAAEILVRHMQKASNPSSREP